MALPTCSDESGWSACQQPALATLLRNSFAAELGWSQAGQLPIVYHDKYNISFGGLEKLHPFDSCKFSKVVNFLNGQGLCLRNQLTAAPLATEAMLLDVHAAEYMEAITTSALKVAQVTELGVLSVLPNWLVQQRVVLPMRYHVGGTILAAALAMQSGWSMNIGGGMHHAHHSDGMGWCPFDDITLAVRRLRSASGGQVTRVLLVDLDAHQGNGVERDKLHFHDKDLMILDAYNKQVFPGDQHAKAAVDVAVELLSGTTDSEYIDRLQQALQKVRSSGFQPQLIIYNAGTDILAGDPLGQLDVSAEGVIERDEIVFNFALSIQTPICMLLSGGYSRSSATVIGQSIDNLFSKLQLKSACHL